MEYVILALLIVNIIIAVVILVRNGKNKNDDSANKEIKEELDDVKTSVTEGLTNFMLQDASMNSSLTSAITTQVTNLGANISKDQSTMRQEVLQQITLSQNSNTQTIGELRKENQESIEKINKMVSTELHQTLDEKLNNINKTVGDTVSSFGTTISNGQSEQRKELKETLDHLSEEFTNIRNDITKTLIGMQESNTRSLNELRVENQASMDKINDTVNEKLQKTLDDKISKSFEAVRTQLAEVHKGLGEMKDVASGVTDLKNVLSNVKTRGIIGEYQLDSILKEILTSDQYESQCSVVPGSSEKVDFAIKLPGTGESDSSYVYLPIDSKFPGDTYHNLVDAYDSGDINAINNCKKTLKSRIAEEAKSIHDKYIAPPYTTDFAIIFLPFEGLYSEAVNMGLLEELQNKYKVNIAGPSTMAALLNSFRMGFRTLAIQKRSGEVWKTLEAVKKEFETFESGLNKMKERLNQADTELDKLIGTRTNAINRKLRGISTETSLAAADEILEIGTIPAEDGTLE